MTEAAKAGLVFDLIDTATKLSATNSGKAASVIFLGVCYDVSMPTNFIKMQGLGNTFVVCLGPEKLSTDYVRKACEVNQVDGLLMVTPISKHSVKMKYWNADGSLAEMCGNGIRCVVRFAVDKHLVEHGNIEVQTDAGILQAKWDGVDPNKIEVQVGKAKVENAPIKLRNREFFKVNVGNPHAITFVEDVNKEPVTTLGPIVENDSHFPNRTNVEFVQVESSSKIKLRAWERGVGETKACGTGMVAAALTASHIKKTLLPLTVAVPGGEAKVWLDETGYFRMLGPAQYEN